MAQEKRYDHREVEQKWQRYWDEHETFKAEPPSVPPERGEENAIPADARFGEEGNNTPKPKYYILDMFPYPSGAGLHVGHPEGYTATDIIARYKRMRGFNVLHPMGWDAFGLPAENYAIKTGEHPDITTKRNIATFKRQIKSLGFSYDWSREFATTDPEYYAHTQWIFLQMYKKGLLYEKEMPMNWCPSCRIVAANEEVENGLHERCNTPVEKRNLTQWMFRITDYAERLLNDLEELKEWPEKIIAMQRNWIGKSEGAEVGFDTGVLRGAEYFDLSGGHSAVYHLTFNTETGVEISEGEAALLRMILRQIARENNFYIAKGAIMPDHVHLVVSDPEEREMGKLMNRIKGASSRLLKITRGLTPGLSVRDTDSKGNDYERIWRDGYHFEPVRTVADLARVIAYVEQNPEKEGLKAQYRTFEDLERITVYTTRPDTLFGATYMVLAPEHELVEKITTSEQKQSVEQYLEQAQSKSDLERTELSKEKTGVFTGAYAINPVNNEQIPIWIADYVLASYGTGAIMAVPAHDERDFAFAQKFDLPIRTVVQPSSGSTSEQEAFAEEGVAIDSDFLNGLPTAEAKEKMIQWLEEKSVGKRQINYKLRDWIFTRQRYWGEPIPLVKDEAGKVYPLDESELPVKLPDTDSFLPAESGESPLAKIRDWVEVRGEILDSGSVKLSVNGSKTFFRETSTMPNWAGSNWYWLRFMDSQNASEPWSKAAEAYWGPVDLYVGGAEHAVLHLLYSRFWHKVFYDMSLVHTKEPFKKLMNQGLILAEDGQKMSKSLGNVVNPDEIVEKYGADTLRMYEMFMGPFEQSKAWNTDAVDGMYRFLQRIWRIFQDKPVSAEVCPGAEFRRLVHKSVKKITEDIEGFKFNTAVSQLMILVNAIQKLEVLPKSGMTKFVQLLAPFAPHLAEEIWSSVLQNAESISKSSWPTWDEALTVDDEIELAIQVSGKLRATIRVPTQIAKEQAIALAKTHENVIKHLEGKEIIKEIFVPGKIVNLVVKG